jgi:hypothetical protein
MSLASSQFAALGVMLKGSFVRVQYASKVTAQTYLVLAPLGPLR